MKEQYIQYYSNILETSVDLLITGHWGFPVLMFPTSLGTAFQNRDSGLLNSASNLINEGRITTFDVGNIDSMSFYHENLSPETKIYNYNLYTQFLASELIPQIQKQYSVHRVGVAGCSFGAYHALNFACKYPDLVSFAIGMSGNYDISSFMHGFHNDNVYYNNPVEFMANSESWKYNHMKIVIGTSDWDICRDPSVRFSGILGHQNINHIFDEKKWAKHDWPLWRMVFPQYLSLVL